MDRSFTRKLFETAARADRLGVGVTRLGLIVVLLWIGSLKASPYEADGIVSFVANSPTMNFFYIPPRATASTRTRKANWSPANRRGTKRNGTYIFAYGLGA